MNHDEPTLLMMILCTRTCFVGFVLLLTGRRAVVVRTQEHTVLGFSAGAAMAHKGTGMSESDASSSADGAHNTGSDATAASSSCIDAFDALWFCYSPGHQVPL